MLVILLKVNIMMAQSRNLPNFIIIFADDLGYGDLSCFGHPTIRTPNLDRMAVEGLRLTQFYVGANVCSPSRAALLTGRLPVRTGMYGNRGVFFPNSSSGLPHDEITIAQALKSQGYQNAIVGKWHLGSQPEYLPLNYGFDYYFGIPYSNDMGKIGSRGQEKTQYVPLPLYRNNEVIEEEPDQRSLTKRYTEEVISFIRENRDLPFFVYYPNNFPHTPLYASNDYLGASDRGLYGDVVEELDWSVGQILEELKELGLDDNTLVLFTSDNGPWLTMYQNGGSAGLLFEGKASTYEGGMRVPAIAWWPGKIPANTISTALAATMDIFPTFMALANIEMPSDRVYDGLDIKDMLFGEKEMAREIIYYYASDNLYAIRKGPWKAHFTTRPSYSREPPETHDPPLLYNLDIDPSEKYDVGEDHPEIIEDLKREYEKQISELIPAPPEFDKVITDAASL